MAYKLFLIFFAAFIVNNILLIRFIALCSFFGVSNKIETSISMGFAVIFVMVISTTASWMLYYYILEPYQLIFLRTIFFIMIIAFLVQFEEMFIKKYFPVLYRAMGIYLPLITTNCAILAVAFLTIDYRYNLIESVIYAIGVSGGYLLAIVIFASLRERIDNAPIPESFKGYPIAFILASLMSLSFLGFLGMFGLQL